MEVGKTFQIAENMLLYKDNIMIPITQMFIPVNTKRRSGQKLLGVQFIVCHDVGVDSSTALQNANYYIKSANEVEASAHFFVDDKQIIQVIPSEEKAWHVRRSVTTDNQLFGLDANDYALSVELCYSTRNAFDSRKAYENYCILIADLCHKYNLDPKKHLVGHYTLDPTRRSDPINAFQTIGKTWNDFISDVCILLTPVVVIITPPKKEKKEKMVSIRIPRSKYQLVVEFLKTFQ